MHFTIFSSLLTKICGEWPADIRGLPFMWSKFLPFTLASFLLTVHLPWNSFLCAGDKAGMP